MVAVSRRAGTITLAIRMVKDEGRRVQLDELEEAVRDAVEEALDELFVAGADNDDETLYRCHDVTVVPASSS